jgi:IS5 family transposase
LKIKKGVIQDATFITAEPGHQKVDEPRGPEAKTRRNKEGEWAKNVVNPITVINYTQ